ncbi:hypothetical protein F5B17DRAFT_150702 [Nemania serpens]|nr:hypothetical protein F5B17DRAFT_150702 [Nemania serpens]
MAFVPQPVPQVEVLTPARDVQRSPSPRSDIDGESVAPARDIDSISIDSNQSVPDFGGRKLLTFNDDRTTTAYEAWELVSIEDRHTRQSWKSFMGINFGTKWLNLRDGCVLVNPLVSFDQSELADMHEDAIRRHKHKPGTSQETAYEQALANQAYNLPCDIYDKIQQLIEDKTMSTNKNPYRHREWRVVVLQPGEFRMTELLPERKRKGIFSWKKQPPATRTWFVVLRGQEAKWTKQDSGWRAFNRLSNPWWRLDNQETKEERDEHKQAMKKMDRARNRDRRPRYSRSPSRPNTTILPYPHPRPIAPILPYPQPPIIR